MSFFNPPDGNAFMLTNHNGTAGRNIYTFTVSRKTVKAPISVTIRFNLDSKYRENTGWAYFNTSQLY